MEERLTYRGEKNALFSHDGIHDSQTHLASPTYFYQQLEQEIALTARNNEKFSLIRILFNKSGKTEVSHGARIDASDILYFSEALKDLTRKQDCVARVGINECIIIIRANKSNVEALLSRLLSAKHLTVENTLTVSLSTVEFEYGEKALTILNRLDTIALSTHKFE